MVVAAIGLDRGDVATWRLRIGIGIERSFGDRSTDVSRPPASADAFVGVALPGDVIGQVWNTAGMGRCRFPREARTGEVKAAPPEVRGAAFADESTAEILERTVGEDEDLPTPMRGVW